MRDRLIELLLSKSCMTNECPDVYFLTREEAEAKLKEGSD